ncbi:MAG: methyltransferase regulatory domain-containing protein, partial [Chthoniobacteraceae bacterium]
VAYLSYNTLPGWGLLLGLRAFLLGEMRGHDTPQAQLEHTRAVLPALDKCLASQSGAYASLLRECLADMRRKPAELLFHDELSRENHPRTFTDLLTHAARHDLQYLAEAHFATMPIENLPADVRAQFVALNLDFLAAQQFMDVVYHRSMRNSLLCRGSQSGRRAIDVRVIGDCAIALRMRIASDAIDLSPGVPLRLESSQGMVLEIAQPAEKAMAVILARTFPNRVPFGTASHAASDLLARANLPSDMSDPSAQAALLYRLFTLDAVDLVLSGHRDWLRPAEPAAPSPLMRYQAAADFLVANRWHEPIRITGDERARLADPGCTGNIEARSRAGLLG